MNVLTGEAWSTGALSEADLRAFLSTPIKIPTNAVPLRKLIEDATGKEFVYLASDVYPTESLDDSKGPSGESRVTVTVGEYLDSIIGSLSECQNSPHGDHCFGVVVTDRYLLVIRIPVAGDSVFGTRGAVRKN
jgi:hypothetical protein